MRLRWPIVGAWLVVLVVGFWASGRLSALQSNVFSVPGTDSEHVRSVLQHHFGDRSDGAFTVVFRVPRLGRSGDAGPAAARARPRRRARFPTGQGTALAAGRAARALRERDLHAQPGRRRRGTRTTSSARRTAGRRAGVRHRRARRSRTTSTRSSAGTWRRASRSRCRSRSSSSCSSSALSWAVTIPFLFAASTVFGTLSLVYVIAHFMTMPTYVDEPGLPDRARDRDRLLAADRLPLPRGAGARTGGRGGGRADDADGRTGGDLLRGDGRDRARAADLHAAAVHPRDRDRRLPAPGRLDPGRGDAAAGAALDLRAPRHAPPSGRGVPPRPPAAAGARAPTGRTTSSTASGRAWRGRSCGGSGVT